MDTDLPSNGAGRTLEIPIGGMDCAECARHVQKAVCSVEGVRSAEVLLAAEKAILQVDRASPPSLDALRAAVERSGYTIRMRGDEPASPIPITGRLFRLLGLVFGAVLLVIIGGEWLGLFASLTRWIPLPLGIGFVLLIGYPAFAQVVRAAWNRQIIAHTLMSVGAVAALLVGEWMTAAIVVFFMRIGDYVEKFTAERARESVRLLAALAPRTARVIRGSQEVDTPVDSVVPGDQVLVRPGERIPVDGQVVDGFAAVDQSTVTGESLPIDAGPGTEVFAGTFVHGGMLRIETSAVGDASTIGRIVRLVEEAESRKGSVQRTADRFSAIYLPVVAGIALLTFLIRQDVMATVAVLVVACSCAFALATPVAILATIGASARRGLLIKGGVFVEILPRVDVLLLDKTGTVTFGRPGITDVIPLNGWSSDALLALAASAERHSEHPLGRAVCDAASRSGLPLAASSAFEAIPGLGVRAEVDGRRVVVGNAGLAPATASAIDVVEPARLVGKSLLMVDVDGEAAGILVAEDQERPEVAAAIADLAASGIRQIELLTGDNEGAASALAKRIGVPYRAGLMPQDKIEIVRRYQAEGHVVAMVGDGVNDAPALAQADVGIAMGAAGSEIAMEAAPVLLLRDDWTLLPELFQSARRTLRVVYGNIGFTAAYNLVGLTLAAFGILPPILAAAAQSLPDLGILANSARLIRVKSLGV